MTRCAYAAGAGMTAAHLLINLPAKGGPMGFSLPCSVPFAMPEVQS